MIYAKTAIKVTRKAWQQIQHQLLNNETDQKFMKSLNSQAALPPKK